MSTLPETSHDAASAAFPPPCGEGRPRSERGGGLRIGAADCLFVVALGLFAIGGLLTLLYVPFPTAYDELQHLSFIHALRDAPALFPHYGAYRVLRPDLAGWTDAFNYIAHPPLYYLLLAPFGDNITVLRAINLAMALAGFALCAHAGLKLLGTTGQRIAFLALLLVFSKPALIAGMVNNDNLVLLETGVLFQLLARAIPSCHAREGGHPDSIVESRVRGNDSRYEGTGLANVIAIAAVLALTGWTKFNAFVGLTLWVGLLHLATVLRRNERAFGRASFVLLAGVAIGALPALINLATIGSVAYVPVDFLFVEPSARQSYDFPQFVAAFFGKIGQKIFFMDGVIDLMPAAILMILLGPFAAFAAAARRTRDIAVAAWAAALLFATVHVFYGWNSFRMLGSMSDAQSRYYAMLWPGLSLAAVLGAAAIADRLKRPARARTS